MKVVFIPIESYSREFHSRWLLALELANRGCKVLIGYQPVLNRICLRLKNGVFISKAGPNYGPLYKNLKEKSHKIIEFDEEGPFIHENLDHFFSIRLKSSVFNLLDAYVPWGARDRDFLLSRFKKSDNKLLDGTNPRVIMWKDFANNIFNRNVDLIRKEQGPFILVASNFGVNHHLGIDDFITLQVKNGILNDDMISIKEFRAEQSLNYSKFLAFVEVIRSLAAKTDQKIIVRPHPIENQEKWKELTSDIKNIHIIKEGSVTPWILASDFVIHNECTTAFEAVLLGKHVFTTNIDDCGHDFLKKISYNINDFDGVNEISSEINSGLSYNLNCSGKKSMIDERVNLNCSLSELADLVLKYVEDNNSLRESGLWLSCVRAHAKEYLAVIKRKVFGIKDFERLKFPIESRDDINFIIKNRDTLGYKSTKCHKVATDVFLLN